MNEYINLTLDNIDNEHLCCAISDKKHQSGIELKKEWLKDKLKDGHVFRKLNARGKVFIEYEPVPSAWTPIDGDNYMYIYCLWVAGSFKGKGHGKELLNYAIEDSKNKKKSGICVVTSKKKKPFLSDKDFFIKNGFKVVDSINDYELLALSFNNDIPKFTDSAKSMKIDNKDLTIYYSVECPFTINCIKELEEFSKENDININFIKINSSKEAKKVPCIFNNWATFKDGKFVSNSLLNKSLIEKLINNSSEKV